MVEKIPEAGYESAVEGIANISQFFGLFNLYMLVLCVEQRRRYFELLYSEFAFSFMCLAAWTREAKMQQ